MEGRQKKAIAAYALHAPHIRHSTAIPGQSRRAPPSRSPHLRLFCFSLELGLRRPPLRRGRHSTPAVLTRRPHHAPPSSLLPARLLRRCPRCLFRGDTSGARLCVACGTGPLQPPIRKHRSAQTPSIKKRRLWARATSYYNFMCNHNSLCSQSFNSYPPRPIRQRAAFQKYGRACGTLHYSTQHRKTLQCTERARYNFLQCTTLHYAVHCNTLHSETLLYSKIKTCQE